MQAPVTSVYPWGTVVSLTMYRLPPSRYTTLPAADVMGVSSTTGTPSVPAFSSDMAKAAPETKAPVTLSAFLTTTGKTVA